MTRKIFRPVFAVALALGMLAALSSPSRAALSTADRTNAAATPAPEQTTLAAVSAPAAVATPAPAAAAAPVAAKTAPVVNQSRKIAAPKVQPRRIASGSRFGYPCH